MDDLGLPVELLVVVTEHSLEYFFSEIASRADVIDDEELLKRYLTCYRLVKRTNSVLQQSVLERSPMKGRFEILFGSHFRSMVQLSYVARAFLLNKDWTREIIANLNCQPLKPDGERLLQAMSVLNQGLLIEDKHGTITEHRRTGYTTIMAMMIHGLIHIGVTPQRMCWVTYGKRFKAKARELLPFPLLMITHDTFVKTFMLDYGKYDFFFFDIVVTSQHETVPSQQEDERFNLALRDVFPRKLGPISVLIPKIQDLITLVNEHRVMVINGPFIVKPNLVHRFMGMDSNGPRWF